MTKRTGEQLERHRAYMKEWRAKNPDANKKQKRKYRESPEGRAAQVAYMKKWLADNRHKALGYRLKHKYRLDHSDYAAMYTKQRGVCAICKTVPDKFCIDHDHQTGKVRALLCSNCNLMLGYAKDSIDTLQRATVFLAEHGK